MTPLFPKLVRALLVCSLASAAGVRGQVVLRGAGSTFPAPLYEKWFADYNQLDPSVQFKYQGVGSGRGQSLLEAQAVDFGASDAPMTYEALASAPGTILHVPTVGGADVITFNLHEVKELRLDGETLAAIYLGKITQWNDPAIARLNPGTRLPDEDITVVHRSDASGTTYIFTDYLGRVSAEWKLKVGRYLSVNWPTGVGVVGSSGVSGYVKKTPGAIGYVELLYALQDHLSQAAIRNASGAYIKATTASVGAALSAAAIPEDLRLSAVDQQGASAYPISGVTWLLVYQHGDDAATKQKLMAFLKWALTDGQKTAKELNYAPLPDRLRSRVLAEINEISAHS